MCSRLAGNIGQIAISDKRSQESTFANLYIYATESLTIAYMQTIECTEVLFVFALKVFQKLASNYFCT